MSVGGALSALLVAGKGRRCTALRMSRAKPGCIACRAGPQRARPTVPPALPLLCSEPTVTAVNTGGTTYEVTITPVTSVPLVSYPKGGWAYYAVTAAAGIASQGFTCT